MTSIDNGGEDAAVGAPEAADADLVLRTRSGDRGAFGELWYRHYRSGIAVARSMSGLDPDDLVQEAYARIYQSILRGGGPTGSFRAYLFTSIRNTAAAWGRSGRETAMEDLDAVVDPATSEEATESALDRGLTHRAFRSLPSRWQEVLWYTEIEQMKPAEIAPLLGMKPTAVAQLAFRAREGLREAWIQVHLQSLADGSDCQWTVERLGAHARANLSRRDQAKVEAHLGECTRCTIVAAEAKEVSSRLALVLLPLTLGITGSAAYLATLQGGGVPAVALAAGQGIAPGATGSGVTVSVAGGTSAGSTAAGGTGAGSMAASGTVAAGGSAAAGGSVAAGSSLTASASAVAGGTLATTGAVGAGTAATVAAVATAGGIFSSVGAAIGATAVAALIVGGAVTASIAAPDLLPSSWAAESAALMIAEAAADADTVADSAADAAPGTLPGAGPASEESGDAGAPPTAMPSGIPSIGTAWIDYAGTEATFSVPVSGAPGSTVELLVNGGIKATTLLDAAGAGTLAFQPSVGHVTNDATVNARYRVGELTGQPLTVRLSDLADLAAVLAVMKGTHAEVPPAAPSGGNQGNGQGQGSGSANQDPPGQGSTNGQGPGSTNGQGQGSSNGQGPAGANGQRPAGSNADSGAPADGASAGSAVNGSSTGSDETEATESGTQTTASAPAGITPTKTAVKATGPSKTATTPTKPAIPSSAVAQSSPADDTVGAATSGQSAAPEKQD